MQNDVVVKYNLDKSVKNVNNYISPIILLFTFISILLCISKSDSLDVYGYIFILPLTFFIGYFFVARIIVSKNIIYDIPNILVVVLLLIRNVVTPIVMTGDIRSVIQKPSQEDAVYSILIVGYETLALFGIMRFLISNKKRNEIKSKRKKRLFRDNKIFYLVLLGAITFLAIGFIIVPELRSQYYTIFTSDMTHIQKPDVFFEGGIKRIFGNFSELLIESVRLIVCAVLIFLLARKKKTLFNYFICFAIIIAQLFFISDSNAYVLILCTALTIYTLVLFPQYAKKTLIILCCGIVLLLSLFWINRFSQDHYGESVSIFLQAYLPSVANLSGIFNMPPHGIADNFSQIFIDLYAAIPFRSFLLGYDGGLTDVVTLWNYSNNISGQIMPTCAQSTYYFGFILSPLLSCLMLAISNKAMNGIKKHTNPVMIATLIFLAVYASISILCYNFYIFSKGFTQRILFMLLFAILCSYSIKDNQGTKNAKK